MDGAPSATFDPTPRSGSLANDQPFLIGRNASTETADFIGDIDEVDLFNRAVSATDVASIYNAGSAGKCRPSSTPTPSRQRRQLQPTADSYCYCHSDGYSDSYCYTNGRRRRQQRPLPEHRRWATIRTSPFRSAAIRRLHPMPRRPIRQASPLSAHTSFQGTFAASPTTGVVTVTDAHPAGNYTVTVTAFGPGGTTTRTFTLTVVSGTPCEAGSLAGFTNAADVGVGSSPQSIAIGDFNGDGNRIWRLPTSTQTQSRSVWEVAWAALAAQLMSVWALGPLSVAIGDFNGDGKQDLAVANFFAGAVSIRLGDGMGGFSGSTEVSVGVNPFSVAIGDFEWGRRSRIWRLPTPAQTQCRSGWEMAWADLAAQPRSP